MSWRVQALFWSLGVLVFGLLLWAIGDVMLPFVAGMAIAYFLDPVADKLEDWGLPRVWAVIIIFVGFILFWAAAIAMLIPFLDEQFTILAKGAPDFVAQIISFVDARTDGAVSAFLSGEGSASEGPAATLIKSFEQGLSGLIDGAVSGGIALFNIISLLLITPIVSFYLLLDWDRMVATIDSWLPRDHRQVIAGLAGEIDARMAGFVRGTVIVCTVLSIFYASSLMLLGLQFGFFVGIIAGSLSFVPFVGFIVGFLLSGVLALVQYGPDVLHIGLVVGVFLIGQVVEGNFLTPRFVGRNVELHPVWVMFALLAFGALFGFVGILLAIPLAAVSGVLVRFAVKHYLDSRLYTGDDLAARQLAVPKSETAAETTAETTAEIDA